MREVTSDGRHDDRRRAARARPTTSSCCALREAKEELFNLRFQIATGQLDNNRRLRTVRHDIARINTDHARARARVCPVAPDENEGVA